MINIYEHITKCISCHVLFKGHVLRRKFTIMYMCTFDILFFVLLSANCFLMTLLESHFYTDIDCCMPFTCWWLSCVAFCQNLYPVLNSFDLWILFLFLVDPALMFIYEGHILCHQSKMSIETRLSIKTQASVWFSVKEDLVIGLTCQTLELRSDKLNLS